MRFLAGMVVGFIAGTIIALTLRYFHCSDFFCGSCFGITAVTIIHLFNKTKF